jgi:hypothetical protein
MGYVTRMSFSTTTIKKMIKDHGIALTLRKRAASAYSDSLGTVTATNTDYAVRGHFYNYTLEMIDGASILRGDRKVVLDPFLINGSATPQPSATDQIIGLGDTVNIVDVMEVKSGSATMYYHLQVRE